jgi:hypothetical protein
LNGSETVPREALAEFCRKHQLPYVEISAMTGKNLEKFKHMLFDFYHEN